MADTYVNNQGFSPIDTRQLMRQADAFNNRQDVIGDAGFNKALGVAQDVMSLAGPAIGAATPFMGKMGAAVATAAISGVPGGNGQIMTPGLTSYSTSGKLLSMPGTAPGFPGSGGGGIPVGSAPGFPGSTSPTSAMGTAGGMDVSSMDSQINAAAAQNATIMAMQFKMQNMSQTSQMMSNIAKTDSDCKLNAIRNIRS